MSWRKKLLKKSRLYVIIDKEIIRGRALTQVAEELKDSAAGIIQLRDKERDKLAVLIESLLLRRFFLQQYRKVYPSFFSSKTKQGGRRKSLESYRRKEIFLNQRKLFIINDYADIAKIIGADGVHLGQRDITVKIARRLLGRDKIIGVSCHNLKQALRAKKSGADYIGMGPVFATKTKRIKRKKISARLIKAVSQKVKLPVFAIGGITADNLGCLSSAGISRIAVASAIFREKDISSEIRKFHNLLH